MHIPTQLEFFSLFVEFVACMAGDDVKRNRDRISMWPMWLVGEDEVDVVVAVNHSFPKAGL